MPDPQINPTTPKPDDVFSSDRISPTVPYGEEQKKEPQTSFAEVMRAVGGPGAAAPATTQQAALISPFDLAQGQSALASKPTVDTLRTQIKNAQLSLGDIQNNLNTPNLTLKQSQKSVLRAKLAEANTHFQGAVDLMTGGKSPTFTAPSVGGPLGKFIAYLAQGQAQMQFAGEQLNKLGSDPNKQISAADMLKIQMLISKGQQNIDYFATMLSNLVSSLKSIMSVQL